MNSISQTLKLMLLHSKVNLIVLVLLMILVLSFQFKIHISEFPAMMLNSGVAIFLGVYLGGSYFKLKQSYLWLINSHYKLSIMFSFIAIILTYSIIMSTAAFKNIDNVKLLLIPFCFAVFSSQMVLGKNLLNKIVIPIIPIIIVNYGYGHVNINILVGLIMLASLILLFLMYKDNLFSSNLKKESTNKSANTIAFVTTGLSSSQLNNINSKLGFLCKTWLTKTKNSIDWALLMPHTKTTMILLYYSLFIVFMFVFFNDKFKLVIIDMLIALFSILYMGIIIESRHLIGQTKIFSHVFGGNKHAQLRNKILMSLDKNLIILTLLFISELFLILYFFNVSVSYHYFILSIASILLITLAVYPLLLCMNWVNLSFSLIILVFIYWLLLYKVVYWIKGNVDLALSPLYIISFVLGALVIRVITQLVFRNKSIEELMKR